MTNEANIITIENETPLGRAIYAWLYLQNLHLDGLVKSDPNEKKYLAWQTVRKKTNPYFTEGTGMEGYLIGMCTTPEQALMSLITINQNILDSIARLYSNQYNFQSRLIKTLTGEICDLRAAHIWSDSLGAELGKLRAKMLTQPEATKFRDRTYREVSLLPPIVYRKGDKTISQRYALAPSTSDSAKLSVAPQLLKPNQQDAWLVAKNVGRFGHPLVRKFLDQSP